MPRRRDNGASARSAEAAEKDTVPPSVGEETVETDSLRTNGAETHSPRETPSAASPEIASRAMNGGDIADSDSSDEVSDDSEHAFNGDGGDGGNGGEEDEEEEEESEEEILVVLELADFKNHPILDDYKSITIEGIDTPKPKLHIGEYSLHGQLEETVGTHYFYDTKDRTDDNEYRFAGQTTKKIKFTIAPPDEY